MHLDRVIISGGGTGGHIFPALAIANAIKASNANCEILFVGANGKMEMERVPNAGYKIVGLDIRGLQRTLSLENLKFPFRVLNSLRKAKKIVKEFKPQVVIGVGGYASGPTLYAAKKLGIPTLIQEQNSYAGITNKLLGKKADLVCIAYEEAEQFFPKKKIRLTGNPVRLSLKIDKSAEQAKEELGFNPNKPLLLVVGGSLGAAALNKFMLEKAQSFNEQGIQVLWQTGKLFAEKKGAIAQELCEKLEGVKVQAFIEDMATAYAASDLVVSRAGALAVSELQFLSKASILVPSPYVAENHQYKNAMALVKNDAATMVEEKDVDDKLFDSVIDLFSERDRIIELQENAGAMALPNATLNIVKLAEELVHG